MTGCTRLFLTAAAVSGCLLAAGCTAGRSERGVGDKPIRTLTVAAVSCESRIRDVEFNLSRI